MSGETQRGDVYTTGRLKPVTLIFSGLKLVCVCVCVHVQCEDFECFPLKTCTASRLISPRSAEVVKKLNKKSIISDF